MVDEQTHAAMVKAACIAYVEAEPELQVWPDDFPPSSQQMVRAWMTSAITAAILAAEARGWKLIQRPKIGLSGNAAAYHDAAPGWGDK